MKWVCERNKLKIELVIELITSSMLPLSCLSLIVGVWQQTQADLDHAAKVQFHRWRRHDAPYSGRLLDSSSAAWHTQSYRTGNSHPTVSSCTWRLANSWTVDGSKVVIGKHTNRRVDIAPVELLVKDDHIGRHDEHDGGMGGGCDTRVQVQFSFTLSGVRKSSF